MCLAGFNWIWNNQTITIPCTSHTCLGYGTQVVQVSLLFLFRLILIAEKDKVYDKFPIPLINRLEKHLVTTSTILLPRQQEVLRRLEQWIDGFTEVQGYIISCTVVPFTLFCMESTIQKWIYYKHTITLLHYPWQIQERWCIYWFPVTNSSHCGSSSKSASQWSITWFLARGCEY